MSVHKLQFKQIIAQPIEVVWQFFSNPNNLETITPPEMGFKHTVYEDDCVYAGMIILHKVKPVLNLPINWMTEITQVTHQIYLLMNNVKEFTVFGIINIILNQWNKEQK